MKNGFILCLLLMLFACQPIAHTRFSNTLSAVGSAAISTQTGNTTEEKIFKAMRASKLEAYKELTEQLYGIQINSRMRVYDQSLVSDSTAGMANGIIRAARVLKSYQIGDTYITELEVNLDRMKEMSALGEANYVPRDDKVIF